MIKKAKLLLVVFIAISILAGCNKKQKSVTNTDNSDFHYANQSLITKQNNNYYYSRIGAYGNYIEYIDLSTNQMGKLCSKPDCNHEIENEETNFLDETVCNAYQGPNISGMELLVSDNKYIYCFGHDKTSVFLMKISLDGSVKEKIVEIAKTDVDAANDKLPIMINSIIIKNEKIYFTIDTVLSSIQQTETGFSMGEVLGTIIDLYSVELSNNKLEKLNSFQKEDKIVYHSVLIDNEELYVEIKKNDDQKISNLYNINNFNSSLYDDKLNGMYFKIADNGVFYINNMSKTLNFYDEEKDNSFTITDFVDKENYYSNFLLSNDMLFVRNISKNIEIYIKQDREELSYVFLHEAIPDLELDVSYQFVGLDENCIWFYNLASSDNTNPIRYLDIEKAIQGKASLRTISENIA